MDFCPAFSGALLAGGRSRRMGADKALCVYDGRPFWECQWTLLQEAGSREQFVCGPRRESFPPEVECVPDLADDRGPLGGLAAALLRAREPHVLVLAVDMPRLSLADLRVLAAQISHEVGCVPFFEEGGKCFYEPLAAIYPKSMGELVRDMLSRTEPSAWSPQSLVRNCVESGLMKPWLIPPEARERFRSLNSPADLRVSFQA